MMKQKRKMPLGIQDFEEMRRGDYLYVDKTDIVWQLANGIKYNFLSRPRRFGKSLLCSTLKCYFEGRKELFEGLKIMQMEEDWVKRPVIYLSMSLGGSSAQELKEYLHYVLSTYEKFYGKNPNERSLGNRLNGIIQRAYEQSGVKIAVIVDEYDVPLLHTYETNQYDECREIYRNFFTGLKDYGYCIKCVFITGITKFTQFSLFSMLNTLTNISFDGQYAAICGLTHEELAQYYPEEIERLALRYTLDVPQVLSELKATYDGYHFSRNLQNVYNPFSVLNALSRSLLNSYWIATGSNEMLNKLLKKYVDDIPSLDGSLIDADYLEMSDVNMDEPKLFLYQSGYLTIKGYINGSYLLGIPNFEVKQALNEIVLPTLAMRKNNDLQSTQAFLNVHLSLGNLPEAMKCLKALIADVPYSNKKLASMDMEERYRLIMSTIFNAIGCRVEVEKMIATGRIDMVVETTNFIYVLELKLSNNGGVDAATEQMKAKQYAEPFKADKRKVIALAIELDDMGKGLVDWKEV